MEGQTPLRVPVLLLIFNRPATTKRVFEAIRSERPSKLAEGPRFLKPIPIGTLLAIGLVVAVIGLTSNLLGKSKRSKMFSIAAILLCLYSLFLSGVRGPLISAIVGLSFYFFILLVQRPRVLVGVGSVVLLLLVTFNMWYPHVPNMGGYRLQAITQGLSTQDRLERYRAAAELFAENPLMGVGTDGYAQLTGLGYPHNIFLEVGSENGLIGLLVFLCFLGAIAWYGFRWLMHSTRLDSQARAIGLSVLVVALTLLVEKQFSYGLTMHKDLFAFLGLVVNLPLIARLNSGLNYRYQSSSVEYRSSRSKE